MSTRTRRASALVVIVVAVALLAAAVARWGWSTRDVHRDAVEVPVMWVERTDDGGLAGGVSAVGVKVEHSGSAASLAVNLNDSTTGSTGTSWNASSASAAAVAMLYSGQDPRGVEITFRVDDAIDGSSAGGALTVGVLAALRGDDLRPGVTMTGTVSPDGSIGSVDGVEAKVRGAAAAG